MRRTEEEYQNLANWALQDLDTIGPTEFTSVVPLRREDAWANTPEHRELLACAHADSAEGRVHQLTEQELAALGDEE